MQQSTYAQKTQTGWEWHFKRNCSISPKQLIYIFASLAIVSLLIGTVFYFLGASLILPFSFVEILVLSVAFYYNAMHAIDFERLVIDNNLVIIERKKGRQESEIKLTRGFTRVQTLNSEGNIIIINQGELKTTFGHHVHPNYREKVMRELRERL
jgi:uncharacterized membrane protein